jgi:hypothetical protein
MQVAEPQRIVGSEGPAVAIEEPPAAELSRLDPEAPVWIDVNRKQVVVEGEVCLREGMLELFACRKGTKEHESVLSVPVRPLTVHAGLLAVGALPGRPAHWAPKFEPAEGTTVELTLFWTDDQGKRQRARAQDWIRQVKSRKAMEGSWVFAGSGLIQQAGKEGQLYGADVAGELICVTNFPHALLDVAIESTDKAEQLLFEAFTERIPPKGTKVTLVLTPKQPIAKAQGRRADHDGAASETKQK